MNTNRNRPAVAAIVIRSNTAHMRSIARSVMDPTRTYIRDWVSALDGVAEELEKSDVTALPPIAGLPGATDHAPERSWALGTLLANIAPDEIERIVGALTEAEAERLAAVVLQFRDELVAIHEVTGDAH